jgi:hypothetical protein
VKRAARSLAAAIAAARPRRAGALFAAAIASIACQARADQPSGQADQPSAPPPIEIIAALAPAPSAGLGEAIFVGRAGELYYPAAPGRWQRRGGGGVAVDLVGAVRGAGEEVLAIAAQTPPYHFRAGAWRAEPLGNRGPAALSATGPLPALAIGRHVYTLDGGDWVRRASASQRVLAAWAAAPRSVVVATTEGLARWEGRRFASLRTALASGDAVVDLIGASTAALYGRSRGGAWVRIDRASTALLTPAAELAGLEVHAAGTGPDGKLWLAGTAAAPSGARRPVLARAERDRLLLAGEMPELAGDRAAALLGHARTGEVLVATRAGSVRVRDKKGTWSQGSVSADLPPAPRTGSASGAPARTR